MVKFICKLLLTFVFSIININTSYVNATNAVVTTPSPIVKKNTVKKAVLPKKATLVIEYPKYKGQKPIILYKDNANEIRHPASLTKIMTVYLLLEAIQNKKVKFNTEFKVSELASKQMPSKLNLKAGTKISVKDCIKALLVKSANDVAVVVAEGLYGSVSKFCKQMNKKAKELGMKYTNYENPSGVPNDKQVTCANDIATLGLSLINKFNKENKYWQLFALKNFTYNNKTHGTHCKILRWYNGIDAVKTGYICASGFNLWVTATRFNKEGKSKRLCVIIFGEHSGRERDFKAARLLDKYFGDYKFTSNNQEQNKTSKKDKSKLNTNEIKCNNLLTKNKKSAVCNINNNITPKIISNKQKEITIKTNNKNVQTTTNNKNQSYNKGKVIPNKSKNITNNISQNNKEELKNNKYNINNKCEEEVLYEIESFPMDDIIKSTGKSKEYFDDLYKDDIPLHVESSTPIDFSKISKKKDNPNKNTQKSSKNIKKTNNKKFIKKQNNVNNNNKNYIKTNST